jgi:hypothetical protein
VCMFCFLSSFFPQDFFFFFFWFCFFFYIQWKVDRFNAKVALREEGSIVVVVVVLKHLDVCRDFGALSIRQTLP